MRPGLRSAYRAVFGDAARGTAAGAEIPGAAVASACDGSASRYRALYPLWMWRHCAPLPHPSLLATAPRPDPSAPADG